MRKIRLDAKTMRAVQDVIDNGPGGRFVAVPVHLGWPELQLTDEQLFANAMAMVFGKPRPYEDKNLVMIEIEIY